jgi:SAM-dependent methyltransferase
MADRLFADDYLAGLYDVWHPRSQRDDYDFYLPRIMSAGSVLDVGCGTGTLLTEARRRGHRGRLCGLDPAQGMLARARQHSDIDWVLGDLRSARWTSEFDLVVMTGHAFQVLLTDDELAAAVSYVRQALKPGGRFAFETRNPLVRSWEGWRPDNAVTLLGPGGEQVTITTEVVAPFDGDTVSFTHTFTGDHPSLNQVSRSTLRFLDEERVDRLLGEAGFQIEERFGDFQGGAMTIDSPEVVTIARSAPDAGA